MKLHEYQAKALFAQAGLPVPEGRLAESVSDAVAAAETLGYPSAIKAQVLAGGRGKAGGIRLVSNREDASDAAGAILGMSLQTAQTSGHGHRVSKVLVEQGQDISKELYLSILPDRATATLMLIASTEGGMNIEDVAEQNPEKILRIRINPLLGLQPYHQRRVAFGLGLAGPQFASCCDLLQKLYQLVVSRDLLLAEVNPLAVTTEGQLILLDAKVEVDETALFRHKDLIELQDTAEEDPLEVEAKKHHLNYIRLEGNIGTMVNGAGLAMATMDMIKQAGGEPANFLDVGGGANTEMIKNGFRILLADDSVAAILINIFGGILRCDVLADGVVKAAREVELNIPVVVRMEGTNVVEGRKILADSDFDCITAVDLQDAAEKISTIARQL